MNYTDQNFDINTIISLNNIDALMEVSNYLDFSIQTTLSKQFPGARDEQVNKYASSTLRRFLNGNTAEFSSAYNTRENMNKVGTTKVRFLLWQTLIERHACNETLAKITNPTEFIDVCAKKATEIIAGGDFTQLSDWFYKNKGTLIDNYIQVKYSQPESIKNQYQQIALDHPVCSKALEQLNLELQLQEVKEK